MYAFCKQNGITLCRNGEAVLENIRPWVNPHLRPWEDEGLQNLLTLTPCEFAPERVSFRDEHGIARLTLSLRRQGDAFALYLSGTYDLSLAPDVETAAKFGTHLDPFCALGFSFAMPRTGRFADAYMPYRYWQAPFVGSDLKDLQNRTQALLIEQNESLSYLMTVCDRQFKTELFPCEGGVSLAAHANTVLDSIDECVLVGACGDDAYALPEKAVSFGLAVMEKPGALRKNKTMPELFEYLGWCSWDAFQMQVTHRDLCDKAEEFKEKNIPVKWFILDDMWGDVTGNDLATQHGRELNDWEADPKRFPEGLRGVVRELKTRYGLKAGIWHPTGGYWFGINPNGPLAARCGDLLAYTVPGEKPDGSRLMHSFEKDKLRRYYDLQHAFYKDCGVDFTKVDDQGSCEHYSFHQGSIGQCVRALHGAIEEAADKYYGGTLINCMGMPIENFWNRASAVNRFSGDFQPENRKWFIRHLLQCSYNSLTQGTVYIGDWDMWWSDDAQAKKNAVLRAMSGGPIYMSDKLGRSIREVILPTVLSDGRILRFENPCLPTRDCLFEDAEHNGRIFKVFNRQGKWGVLAAFNLDEEEKPVTGAVSPCDALSDVSGDYCVYDWFAQKAVIMHADETMTLSLANYDDFRLFVIVPVEDGRAVIGLKEKYLSPMALETDDKAVTARDDGTLLVWAKDAPAGFIQAGENLFAREVRKGERVIV